MKFDNLLSFFSSLNKTHFFRDEEAIRKHHSKEPLLLVKEIIKIQPIKNFKTAIKKISLPKELLSTIEREFYLLRSNIDKKIEKLS